jgi:FtsP/CotA-like multicopper oxidase with cupredoxin domain
MQTEQSTARTVTVQLEARETDWEVEPGHTIRGYAFNGQVPGPTIEAEVGDTLVVELTNALSEPTTIHWHGLRVPAEMDGTQMMQRPIAPGERFAYRFTVPDAATFWYHPHANETEQLEKGLYGALIVRDPSDPAFDDERVLVLDDLKLDKHGDLAAFGGRKERHDGRRGNAFLVNGTLRPELTMRAGQVERWRIVNASSSRYVNLSLGGRPFSIVGTDGGLISAPVETTEVLLAPADRVDLAVGPFEEGANVGLDALPYGRGMIKEDGGRYATLHVGEPAPSRAAIPSALRSIEPLAPSDAAPTRTIRLGGSFSLARGVDWKVNEEAHHVDDPVRVGELQIWEVVNETGMDHPLHLHGFFFQVLEIDGAPPAFSSWEDTINIPVKGRAKIAWVADDRPGSWMYHCHILEHHAAGMMGHFDVIREGSEAGHGSHGHH